MPMRRKCPLPPAPHPIAVSKRQGSTWSELHTCARRTTRRRRSAAFVESQWEPTQPTCPCSPQSVHKCVCMYEYIVSMINNMRSNLVFSQNFLSEDGAQEDDDSVGRAQRRHRLNAAKLVQLLSGSSGGVLR